jgi:hypothetical protein
MSNLGVMQLSYESLAQLLNLPKGHTITAVVPQDMHAVTNQQFSFVVSGPTLPNHIEGAHPQFVQLIRDTRGKTAFC